MDSYFAGFGLVVFGTLMSIAGLLLVRKRFDAKGLAEYHEVGGYLFAVVGTLYAVLLGLVVVDAMSRFQAAEYIVEQEANALADIFQMSSGMPSLKREMRIICNQYVDEVLAHEWEHMDNGGYSPVARQLAGKLWKCVLTFQPVTEGEKAVFPAVLSSMSNFADARRDRLVSSSHGTSPVMWVALIVGAMFTISFTYFFGLDNLKAQVLMTGVVAMSIFLNLLLVSFFGYPFSGDVKVQPDEFKMDQVIFRESMAGNES